MENVVLLGTTGLMVLVFIIVAVYIQKTNSHIKNINKILDYQNSLIIKIQSVLKNKSATNAVTENAEMIYQDLLQNLIPIMASIDVMPRNTPEHPLWRAQGGVMDEYSKNPFTLEKLRRNIKLNSEIARSVDNYIRRAESFLQYLANTENDTLLSSTFTDGLLGQSLTFFTQAKQLAAQS